MSVTEGRMEGKKAPGRLGKYFRLVEERKTKWTTYSEREKAKNRTDWHQWTRTYPLGRTPTKQSFFSSSSFAA